MLKTFYMPRFSTPFNRRKSAPAKEELRNTQTVSGEQHSFRVIERKYDPPGRSFDGGARLARALVVESDGENNMFADLETNR